MEPPTPVTFWRSSLENVTKHRNPFFIREYGLTPAKALTVDMLHCWYLGVCLVFGRVAIWFFIDSGIYADVRLPAAEQVLGQAQCIRADLWAFYRRHRAAGGAVITEVSDLTPKMLGVGMSKRKLKVKAAECWGITLFVKELFERYSERLGRGGKDLHEAGSLLLRFYELAKASSAQLTVPCIQDRR